jgi:hypothetical protein
MTQPKKGARDGFANRKRKARNNMEIPDILTANTETVLASVVYMSALCGACFIINTNKARSAVKITLLLDEDREEEWLNTPEEATDKLVELNEMLVETARAKGYLPAPVTRETSAG